MTKRGRAFRFASFDSAGVGKVPMDLVARCCSHEEQEQCLKADHNAASDRCGASLLWIVWRRPYTLGSDWESQQRVLTV